MWIGDVWNVVGDVYRCADRRDRDTSLVSASQATADYFGTAGLGSAAALLELLGHRIAPLNAIGLFAAAVETVLLIWLGVDKHGVADRAIHEHRSGWLIRIGEVLTGPLPLVLRFFGAIPLAAISFLLGALVSRFGWIAVGKISGRDPEAVFASQK